MRQFTFNVIMIPWFLATQVITEYEWEIIFHFISVIESKRNSWIEESFDQMNQRFPFICIESKRNFCPFKKVKISAFLNFENWMSKVFFWDSNNQIQSSNFSSPNFNLTNLNSQNFSSPNFSSPNFSSLNFSSLNFSSPNFRSPNFNWPNF